MFSYAWPIGLVVISNIVYHICSKCSPKSVNPFASLTMVYLVAAACSAGLYTVTHGGNILREFSGLNWTSYVLGVAIIGLEAGYLYAYRVGWQVSIASIVQSSFLAIVLMIIGALGFHEALTWNKIAGIVICLFGLGLINWK